MVNIFVNLEPSPQGRVGVYYPGQRLAGVVKLELHESKIFCGFYVLITGRAKCKWTETSRSTGHRRRRGPDIPIPYEGNEVYLNSKTYLFGHHGAKAVRFAAGTYKYIFALDLPEPIPGSLSASHGDIAYRIEAVLDSEVFRVPFTVVLHENLNKFLDLKIPLQAQEVKTFCCLFCESDPCLITVTIPYGGYVAGEEIPVKIQYVNKSNTDVYLTRVRIMRIFTFISSCSERKTKRKTDQVAEVDVIGVKRGMSKDIDYKFAIPSILMNTNVRVCRVVRLSYALEVECVVDGCHLNPVLRFPIVIGSVGFSDNSEDQNGQNEPVAGPSAPIPSFMPSAPAMGDTKEDMPPSFDEVMNP